MQLKYALTDERDELGKIKRKYWVKGEDIERIKRIEK